VKPGAHFRQLPEHCRKVAGTLPAISGSLPAIAGTSADRRPAGSGIAAVITLAIVAILAAVGIHLGRLAWWWLTGHSAIILRIYEHTDDQLGAGKYEARRAARIKRWMDLASGNYKAFIRPAQYPGSIQMTRMRRYVAVELAPGAPVPMPWRTWRRGDVHQVTLRWSSEANLHVPSFFTNLEKRLAQALGLEHSDGLFDRDVQWHRDRVTYTRKVAVKLTSKISAKDDLHDL
jgi:hypothetical protein